MITIPNLEHSQESGRRPLDIYAHTQRRLSLNSCSQILARQLSSLNRRGLCTSTRPSASGGLSRPGQAVPGLCLSAPGRAWPTSGHAWPSPSAPGPHLDHAWPAPGIRMRYRQCQEILTIILPPGVKPSAASSPVSAPVLVVVWRRRACVPQCFKVRSQCAGF
jgi:hypothetical protein